MLASCGHHLVEATDNPALLRFLFTLQTSAPWFHVMVSTGEEADCPTGDRMTGARELPHTPCV